MAQPKPLPIELLDYLALSTESPSGLVWAKSPGRKIRVGSFAFATKSPQGYMVGGFRGKRYYAHRVLWLVHYGSTDAFIDHINGDILDNRINNLRAVTEAVNKQNRADAGVYLCGNKWRARIHFAGKRVNIGLFSTREAATAAYLNAKRMHHPGLVEARYGV